MTDYRVNPPEKIRIEGDRKTAIETGRNRLMVVGALFFHSVLGDQHPRGGCVDLFEQRGTALFAQHHQNRKIYGTC